MGTKVSPGLKILKAGKELNTWKRQNIPKECPLCGRKAGVIPTRNWVVDHDHSTGEIRGVLCRNCNGLEGKMKTLCVRAGNWISNVAWVNNVLDYWSTEGTGLYYPGTTEVNGKPVPPKKKRKKRRKK